MTDCQNDNNDNKARLLVLKGLESDGRNFLAAIVHKVKCSVQLNTVNSDKVLVSIL
jgi:hypothetical protein